MYFVVKKENVSNQKMSKLLFSKLKTFNFKTYENFNLNGINL